jgi:ADP-ribose pyrophosphatase
MRRTICSNQFLKVEEYTLKNKPKRKFYRCVTRRKGVSIIPVLGNELVVERQYRYNLARTFLEIPGGGAEKQESMQSTAQRELLEETGFRSAKPKILFAMNSAPEFLNSNSNYLLCNIVGKAAQTLDPTEIITVDRITPQTALALIKSGKINNNHSIIGLLYYLFFLAPKRKESTPLKTRPLVAPRRIKPAKLPKP